MGNLGPFYATATVDRLIAELGLSGQASVRIALLREFVAALHHGATQEREASVAICRKRQTLWRLTGENRATPPHLRAEAQHRENEASYLADAIADQEESPV
jgi:hypothetical protein